MKIATADKRTSKRWRTGEWTWEKFKNRIQQPVITGETRAEYQRMTKDERLERKDQGGFVGGVIKGGRRVKGAVTERWLVTLDADEAREGDWEALTLICDWRMAVYSTHSHTPEKPRLRWLIPLSRAVSVEEYPPLARKLAEYIGIETMDASTYQPERLMFWPSMPKDVKYYYRVQDGPALDPDEILREYGQDGEWRESWRWPTSEREREIVIRETKKAGEPTEKNGPVGRFCRAYNVPEAIEAFLGDVYEKCGAVGTRYTYKAGSTAAGAVIYNDGAFLYSNHGTDPAGEQLCNAFDLVRVHKFGELDDGRPADEPMAKRPSYKAMCAFAADAPEVKKLVGAEDFGDMPDEKGAAGEEEAWKMLLKLQEGKDGCKPTLRNIELIMKNAEDIKGAVATNRFTARMMIIQDLPWKQLIYKNSPELWTDVDDSYLLLWFEKKWKISNEGLIRHGLRMVGDQNSYHPVQDYLNGLTWDGQERVETLLIRYMGAPDNAYVRAVTCRWMCAAVARALKPGCKFDACLILIGPQGIGKSRLPLILSKGWFTDSLTSMGGKEAYEAIQGAWIVELSELAALKRTELENVKNFMTKQSDSYRPAYGRYKEDHPRQCVFFGSTNTPEFIRDDTGGRRWWPVDVPGVDNGRLVGLADEVDQLWAEAVVRYKAGEPLWLREEHLRKQAEEEQAAHTPQNPLEGQIQEFLDTLLPANWEELDKYARREVFRNNGTLDLGKRTLRRDEICIKEIRVEMSGEEPDALTGRDAKSYEIADVMSRMNGWYKFPKQGITEHFGKQTVYRRSTASTRRKGVPKRYSIPD